MDTVEESSADLQLPPEVGINQLGESDNIRNSISWKYLIEFIFVLIKDPEGGTQEVTTPQTTSEPNHKPIDAPRSVPGSSAQGFGNSSWDQRVSASDNLPKYPSPVPIITP